MRVSRTVSVKVKARQAANITRLQAATVSTVPYKPLPHRLGRARGARMDLGALAKAGEGPARITAAWPPGFDSKRQKQTTKGVNDMNKHIWAAAAVALFGLTVTPATAKSACRDAKGHFTKCDVAAPAPAPAPAPMARTAPTATAAPASAAGRCRDAKGHFAKCGATVAPPAAPMARPAPTSAQVAPSPSARCRDAKGHFARCGAPDATSSAPMSAPAAAPYSAPTPQARMAPASRSTATQNTNPAGPGSATAQCRDNTMSFSKHRSGTCSRHGGVAQWY